MNYVACRFTASWVEGGEPVAAALADSPLDAAGRTVATHTPEAVLRAIAQHEPDDARLAVIVAARERGLPSLYDADGLSFRSSFPLLLDHLDDERGRVLAVRRDGDTYTATGWVRPQHRDTLLGVYHVSPGLLIEAAHIADFNGRAVLRVTRCEVVELSATTEPVLRGTSFVVGNPETVPTAELARLGWGEAAETFTGDPADRISLSNGICNPYTSRETSWGTGRPTSSELFGNGNGSAPIPR